MLLTRNIQIVSAFLDPDTETAERIGNDSQLAYIHIPDGNLRTGHRSQSDITSHFDHIGQTTMMTTFQLLYSLYSQKIRSNPRNPGAHRIQHQT